MKDQRHHLFSLPHSKPTGYSFVYTVKPGSNSSQQGEPGNRKNLLYNNTNIVPFSTSKIELLQDILYVLYKLNTKDISPHYDLKGIMSNEDDITDIMLCKDNNVSEWSLLYPDNNDGIALIGHPDIVELASETVGNSLFYNTPFKLVLECKTGDGVYMTNGIFKEEIYLVDLRTLQDDIGQSSNGSAPNGMNPVKILGDIVNLTIDTFQAAKINGPEAQEEAYDEIKIKVTALKQIVEQE